MATQTKDEAQAVLFNEVFIPAFCEKLAAHGIAPRSAADLEEMLKIAESLNEARSNGLIQDTPDEFLKQASDALSGATQAPEAAELSESVKEAAATLTSQ